MLSKIPFGTKRSEVIALLGRNSKILGDDDEPVHIIVDRMTGKTTDAYVEFLTFEDALRVAEKHDRTVRSGGVSRLGLRPIKIEVSSQANLMRALFPLAQGLIWDGARPRFKQFIHSYSWDSFKGFLSDEELTTLVKHAEVPHRVCDDTLLSCFIFPADEAQAG